jgi:hypothetical protein
VEVRGSWVYVIFVKLDPTDCSDALLQPRCMLSVVLRGSVVGNRRMPRLAASQTSRWPPLVLERPNDEATYSEGYAAGAAALIFAFV